jgi:hypothetical protein
LFFAQNDVMLMMFNELFHEIEKKKEKERRTRKKIIKREPFSF